MSNVDYDPRRFRMDEYGNLYPIPMDKRIDAIADALNPSSMDTHWIIGELREIARQIRNWDTSYL